MAGASLNCIQDSGPTVGPRHCDKQFEQLSSCEPIKGPYIM